MTAAGLAQLDGETHTERVRRLAEEANALQLPYLVGGAEGRDTTFGATAPAADPASEPEEVTS